MYDDIAFICIYFRQIVHIHPVENIHNQQTKGLKLRENFLQEFLIV